MTHNPPDTHVPATPYLVKPLLVDFLYIAQHLPEDQRRQWEALGDGEPYDPERMAMSLAGRIGPKWALVDVDATPLAIGGYDCIRCGVWQDWLIGTEYAWAKHWRSITKHCKRIMAVMLEHEAQRLQTISLADRRMARQWFGALGLTCEGVLRGYGVNGEDCVMYARVQYRLKGPPSWLAPEVLKGRDDGQQ